MDWSLFLLLLLGFMVVFMLLQRADPKRRLWVIIFALLVLELARRFVWFRDIHTEGWAALITAALLAFFFWLLVGRYNPPKSADESIKVLGLND
ncbi:MAG: hypothetical protein SF123_20105 [Chloroflexota bacterium]|nr:hypothetical protein [Chloroflexota bacterium]